MSDLKRSGEECSEEDWGGEGRREDRKGEETTEDETRGD